MVESLLHTAPHVTTMFEVDLTAVLAHRERHRADFAAARRVADAHGLLSRCAASTRSAQCPRRIAAGLDDALEIYDNIDIGVGTAVEGKGLVVPIVRRRRRWICSASRATLCDLVARARAKTSSRRRTCAAARSRSRTTA